LQHRGFFTALLLFFITSSLFSFDFNSTKYLSLHDNRYWHTLLHFKNGKSEVDDENFFLSPKGKTNPKAELKALVEALLSEYNQSLLCRFPARINWLLKELPSLKGKSQQYSCNELEKIIKEYDPKYLSLIFPTAHINSPASMYGHTFLRVDSDKKTPLISNAIDYAAITDETNGFLYAYNGLSGNYEGRYSITSYYDKIKEYNDMERRDIWEYELNLTQEEIKLLLYHQFEFRDIYADYFFFNENCSYNLLWLFESAREGVVLIDDFSIKAIPIDTIRAVKKAGFIDGVVYRPSKTKKMQEIFKKIDNKKIANKFLKSDYNLELLKPLRDRQKAYTLDLATEMLRFNRAKNRVEKKHYIANLMKILQERSKIDGDIKYPVKKPINPLTGHKSDRVTIGTSNRGDISFSYKPAFHDIYDLDTGFIEGAYINFFDFEMLKRELKDIKFEKFDIINISSYALRDDLFAPLSWSIIAGFKRDYRDKMQFRIDGGVGRSYKNMGFLYYLFLNPALYYGKDVSVSIAPKIGIIRNFSNQKFGFSAKREFFSYGDKIDNFELFLTQRLSKEIALNVKYNITDSEKRAILTLFYYF